MSVKQLFDALTPEQKEKFGAVKDERGLNAFLAETGLKVADGQSADILEYIAEGRIPLQDDELESVGGGCGGGDGREPEKGYRPVPAPFELCARGIRSDAYGSADVSGSKYQIGCCYNMYPDRRKSSADWECMYFHFGYDRVGNQDSSVAIAKCYY